MQLEYFPLWKRIPRYVVAGCCLYSCKSASSQNINLIHRPPLPGSIVWRKSFKKPPILFYKGLYTYSKPLSRPRKYSGKLRKMLGNKTQQSFSTLLFSIVALAAKNTVIWPKKREIKWKTEMTKSVTTSLLERSISQIVRSRSVK